MSDELRERRISTNYRIKESIDNFKLRVRVVQQKSLLAELFENGEETRDPNFLEEQDRIFSWQEKVFSPFEVDFYGDEKNCVTENQRKYHRRITNENLGGSHLYSYTDNDSYYPDASLLTKDYKSYLSIKNPSALPALQNLKPFSERYNKAVICKSTKTRIRSSHYFYVERNVMHIMVDLSQKDKMPAGSNLDSEILLCTITYDKAHKILTIDPDFMSDDHYTITNSSGIKYNYWIEHASEKPSRFELQQQRERMQQEVQEHVAYKETQLSHGIQSILPNTSRVFLNLNIVSAHQFSFNGLFVNYCIHLPQYWSTSHADKLFGRTQRCNMQNKSAHFSYAADVVLDFNSSDVSSIKTILPSWPCLLISVASFDNWTRYRIEGYGALSLCLPPGSHELIIPTWRPVGSIIDSLRRIFTGGTCELEDITYCGIPLVHEGKSLDKLKLKVVPSGQVKINVNIAHQSHESNKTYNYSLNGFETQSTTAIMNNVENVLEQFKAARERMMQIRNFKC